MNTTRTDAPEWWNNTNFEFRLNSGGQRFLSINGDRNGVTDWIWKTAQEGGKYVYTVEVFVENSSISTWSASEEIQVNYAWKTGGETGWTVANYTNFWSYRDRWAGDWMASHLGGLDLGGNDFANGLDKHGVWADNLMITENGIRVGEDPSWTEVDGIVTEYEGLEKVVKEDANKTLTVTGKAADDGMYVAITVNHKARSAYFDANGDWWRNDNLEFNICGVAGAQNIVMICNGQLRHSAFWDRAAMVTSGEEGNYTTTIELYAAGVSKSYKFFVGVNGDGFNGWLCLDTDMYITPEGLVANSPVYAADVTLDGKLDDAAWTAERLAKSYTTIANGAEVTMVGFSGNYGVHLAFTIKHNRPLNEHCQGDGTQWWNYMGPEVRLGGFHYNQITCGAWNNYTQFCQFGYTNVANNGGEWAYTTVYEMFVPYYEFNGGGHRTSLVVGGVFENGFTRLWGATDWTQNNNDHTTHYVTAEGIVVSEQ